MINQQPDTCNPMRDVTNSNTTRSESTHPVVRLTALPLL